MTIELQTNVCCIKSSCKSGISDESELEFLIFQFMGTLLQKRRRN